MFPNAATELTRGMSLLTTQLISRNYHAELASILHVMSAEPTQIIIRKVEFEEYAAMALLYTYW